MYMYLPSLNGFKGCRLHLVGVLLFSLYLLPISVHTLFKCIFQETSRNVYDPSVKTEKTDIIIWHAAVIHPVVHVHARYL